MNLIEVIAEATDEETAFRVFEIVRPRKAWELEALDDEEEKEEGEEI